MQGCCTAVQRPSDTIWVRKNEKEEKGSSHGATYCTTGLPSWMY